jgi:hypothetical protein
MRHRSPSFPLSLWERAGVRVFSHGNGPHPSAGAATFSRREKGFSTSEFL